MSGLAVLEGYQAAVGHAMGWSPERARLLFSVVLGARPGQVCGVVAFGVVGVEPCGAATQCRGDGDRCHFVVAELGDETRQVLSGCCPESACFGGGEATVRVRGPATSTPCARFGDAPGLAAGFSLPNVGGAAHFVSPRV